MYFAHLIEKIGEGPGPTAMEAPGGGNLGWGI
jgi:hypothetical protein